MSVVAARTNEPIPGYRVLQRIGAGGYGEVWAAQAPGDLTKAIKFVYGLLDEDRASRELKALNRIKGVRHPFLLSLERIEVVDGQLIIVTELADSSLKDRFELCRKNNLPGIPREELLAHMRDAADALDYMSEQHSLQHLDVKPENLLLLGGRVKVADFGLVKDIHDHTASMMGGLTPVYAPPEVFEGRPTRRSDQYSLAIVFQEMLTGVLPFPGRTAAQLAAQHLNAKPRITALPSADQPIIARALAKKPADRYVSCRELIDALQEAGKQPAANASAALVQPAVAPSSLNATQGATAPRTPATMLRELEQASSAIDVAVTGTMAGAPSTAQAAGGDAYQASALADMGPAPGLVDVAPIAIDPHTFSPRPTLFLGLGGTGARVLAKLQQRLGDRQKAADRARFSLLVLDSDARDLAAVQHESGLLRPEDTLALPLRKTQDYRTDSREILQWLSRRWLYNIPRSQLTEGMRPLGRLALVDHAAQAIGRLREKLGELVATAAGHVPRVVIVASASGATGGGMVADISFAARQILDELGQPRAEVVAVLAHGTNRNPQQQELAAVNSLATLTELAQFHRTPYPGDKSCGLAERSAESPALAAAYIVHLGEELSPEQYQGACDKVAQFLLLDSITPAADALEAARRESTESGLRARTIGLIQIGFAHGDLVEQAVSRISRGIVERWLGQPKRQDVRKSIRLLPAAGSDSGPPRMSGGAAVDASAKAAEIARAFGLEIDPLMQAVQQLATDEMGGDTEAFFHRFLDPKPTKDVDRVMLGQWLGAAGEIFGRRNEEVISQPAPPKLKLALEESIARLVGELGPVLRPEVENLVEQPALRVHGAQQVAKALQKHLRTLAEQLHETRNRLAQESQAIEQQLWAAVPDPKSKTKPPRRSPTELQTWFLQHCRLKLLEFTAQAAGNIAHAVQSHVVAAHDHLVDLARDLHHLAVKLATDEIAEEEQATGTEDHLTQLRRMVGEDMRRAEDRLTQELDLQVCGSILANAGGLRRAITAGGAQREALLAQMHLAVRQAVLKEMAKVDIAGATIRASGQSAPLRECLAAAQPWLGPCGGRRRLLCIVPHETAENLTPGSVAAAIGAGEFKQLPAVIPDDSSDVVLLFEIGDLSLRHAAAAIIDQRPDLAELATRLFTRSDVTWTPLVG